MPIRHQLPGYSPLSFQALLGGARSLLPGGYNPRGLLLAELLRRTGARDGRLTDSGTSALRLALERLADEGRVPVALPAFSCFDVATAAVGAHGPVLFYDLDVRTLSPDLESLEAALEAGARSVVIAPLYGFPVDWGGIRTLTDRHRTVVVEDAAQAHGSSFRRRPWGAHGDLVVLSFGRGKGWTGGGGGALLTNQPGASLPGVGPNPGNLQEVRHLAKTTAVWALARPIAYGVPRSIPALGLGETRYQLPHPARSMSACAAAIALGTLESADAEIEQRERAAAEYLAMFGRGTAAGENDRLCLPHPVAHGESGYLRFPVLLPESTSPGVRSSDQDAGASEDWLRSARRAGAERSYPRTLPTLEPLRPLRARSDRSFPGAETLARSLITLPTHSRTTPKERQNLAHTMQNLSG